MNKLIAAIFGTSQLHIAADCQDQGQLAEGQALALSRSTEWKVTCTSGELWVTIEGEYEDYLLAPNESLTLPARRKAVLGGLRGSGYCLAA